MERSLQRRGETQGQLVLDERRRREGLEAELAQATLAREHADEKHFKIVEEYRLRLVVWVLLWRGYFCYVFFFFF